MADSRKDIPSIGTANAQARMREELMRFMGRIGNPLDRAVTVRDLSEAGLIALRKGFLAGNGVPPIVGPGPNAGGKPELDLTPPPTPSGFELDAGISSVFVLCDAQTYLQGHGHAETVVYGVTVEPGDPLPTFSDAVELLTFPGTVASYATDPSLTWRMWIKWRTRDGVLSVDPAGGTNGLEIKTGLDVDRLVSAMTGPGNPFKVVAFETTLPDGTVIPPGTYTSDGYLHNAQITNAKIANLAVDNAKISSMAVDKLTAGSLNVGAYIQSTNYVGGTAGWRINGAGFAEFSGITVRGTVYAASGSIGGILIASDSVRSANYNATTGLGFSLRADGTLDLPSGSIFARHISVSNLAAVSANLGDIQAGTVTINGNGGAGWGYLRSFNKWLNDGVWGWVLARSGADGSVFWDFTTSGARFYGFGGASTGGQGAVIDFNGAFYADSNGYMEIRRANVIDTLNLAGNAVTVMGASTAGNSFTVPADHNNPARLTIPNYNSRGAPVIASISVNTVGFNSSDGVSLWLAGPVAIGLWRNGVMIASQWGAGSAVFKIDMPDGPVDMWATFSAIGTAGASYVTVQERSFTLLACRR